MKICVTATAPGLEAHVDPRLEAFSQGYRKQVIYLYHVDEHRIIVFRRYRAFA